MRSTSQRSSECWANQANERPGLGVGSVAPPISRALGHLTGSTNTNCAMNLNDWSDRSSGIPNRWLSNSSVRPLRAAALSRFE